MIRTTPYLSVIMLNITGFNSPIQRHKPEGWIKKNKTKSLVAYRKHVTMTKTNIG
jgi:hypothetical protein